jgi:hypothetical protein
MRAHDGRVEHLDQMRGRTHRGERVEEGFENASLAQPVEALPYAVPRTETFRQSPAPDVFDGEEMKPFEEAPVVFGFPASPGKARAKHRQRLRPIYLIHPCRHAPRSPNQPETYESRPIQLRNPKSSSTPNSSTQPKPESDQRIAEQPKRARRRLRVLNLFLSRLLIEARLQRGAGLEARVFRRGNFYFFPGRRISPLSGGALTH